MNRRTILLSALALNVPRAAIAASARTPPMTVIYDERYGDARAFAECLIGHGAVPLPTTGDATNLWYGGPRRQLGDMIVGLTTWSDFVIARSCSRELGLRLAFNGRDFAALTTKLTQYYCRQNPSWPGLTRPSRSARAATGGRVKPGHDVSIANGSDPANLVAWLLLPRVVTTA